MDFVEALVKLREGKRVSRPDWNPEEVEPAAIPLIPPSYREIWLELRNYPENSLDPPLPYVVMKTRDNTYVTWQDGKTDIVPDIIATDWEERPSIAEEEIMRRSADTEAARERELARQARTDRNRDPNFNPDLDPNPQPQQYQ